MTDQPAPTQRTTLEQLRLEHADALAELSRLRAENTTLAARLAAVERERDAWGGKASTAVAEAASFKRQRNEAQAWVARLLRRYETPS